MLKKLLLLVLIAAPISTYAQDKIAHINANEIFTKMPEFIAAQAKLSAKSETLEKSAAAIEAEYTALIEKFSTDTTQATPSIVADRQKQIEQLQERYQNFLQTSRAELEQEQQKELAPIQQKMQDAIKRVGDDNNYLYIADAAVFLYVSSSSIDASKLVKAQLGIKE